MKKTCKWLLLAVLTLCLTLAVGVALAENEGVDDWNAATPGATFKLDKDVTLTGSQTLKISAPITIDLNGYKLTIKSTDNRIKSDVTFKNGTIEFATALGSFTGIFNVGTWAGQPVSAAKLTLENVEVIGDSYCSGYAAFCIGQNGEVEIKKSTIDLKKELDRKNGGVFKADGGATNAKLSIIDSNVTLDDAVRGILGCNVTIKNSIFTTRNMSNNVFNSNAGQEMKMTIDNSEVTLESGITESAGLKMGGDSYIRLVNGSKLDVGPHAEGAFFARDNFNGKIELQGKGNTLAVDVPFDVMKKYVVYSEDNYEFTENTEKAFTISPKKEEKPVVAPTAAPAASVPQTGDNSQLGLWFALLLLSGLAIAVAMKKQPKGSNK